MPFSENAMQKHAQSITVIDESDRHFSTFAKRGKPLWNKGETYFLEMQKSVAEYLTKPMENEDFPRPESEKASRIIKKH